MCRVLAVHRSGFYRWLVNPISARRRKDDQLLEEIRKSFEENNQVYGSPRIHQDLKGQGIRCGLKRVARLMREKGIRAQRGYKKHRTKYGKPAVVAENLLNQDFSFNRIDEAWATDITYIRTHEGWLYLAAVMDLCSKRIVGWSTSSRINRELVVNALIMAIWRRRPKKPVIVHSDQGSQYTSHDWLSILQDHDLVASMSRRGNCYDNAVKESFFSTLKMERVRRQIYAARSAARADIFHFIEMFYNPKRKHSALNYQSPNEFERNITRNTPLSTKAG